jgi:cytochrome c-type biogenesis protein CcmH/NrfG
MRYRLYSLAFAAVALLLSAGAFSPASAQTTQRQASIEGRVMGPDGKPVERAIVRLTEEGSYREAGRTFTDGAGRFTFFITSGNYVVEVDPVGHPNLAKSSQDVLVNPGWASGGGDSYRVNFFLKGVGPAPRPAALRFDQQVPAPAKAEYDRSLTLLSASREEAFAALRKAIELFPDYYDALELLGTEYVKDNHLEPAHVVLSKAVAVNPKGERSFYGLGVIYYKAGQYDKAIEQFNKAMALLPDNANSVLYAGLAHTKAGHYADGENALKKAYSMGAKNVPDLHLALTQIYEKTGRFREAANQLKTLLKENPTLSNREQIKKVIENYEKKAA